MGRPRLKYKDNIKMDLTEIWFEGVGRIHLTQARVQYQVLMNIVTNLRIS
jgi:hypothetical protein